MRSAFYDVCMYYTTLYYEETTNLTTGIDDARSAIEKMLVPDENQPPDFLRKKENLARDLTRVPPGIIHEMLSDNLKIEFIDNETAESKYPKEKYAEGIRAGFFVPKENRIFILEEYTEPRVLLHEIGHWLDSHELKKLPENEQIIGYQVPADATQETLPIKPLYKSQLLEARLLNDNDENLHTGLKQPVSWYGERNATENFAEAFPIFLGATFEERATKKSKGHALSPHVGSYFKDRIDEYTEKHLEKLQSKGKLRSIKSAAKAKSTGAPDSIDVSHLPAVEPKFADAEPPKEFQAKIIGRYYNWVLMEAAFGSFMMQSRNFHFDAFNAPLEPAMDVTMKTPNPNPSLLTGYWIIAPSSERSFYLDRGNAGSLGLSDRNTALTKISPQAVVSSLKEYTPLKLTGSFQGEFTGCVQGYGDDGSRIWVRVGNRDMPIGHECFDHIPSPNELVNGILDSEGRLRVVKSQERTQGRTRETLQLQL